MPAGLVLGEQVSSSPMSLPELGFQGARQPSSSCFCFTDEGRGREAK